jgi:ParB-like chromosome segregation protein Spo0J
MMIKPSDVMVEQEDYDKMMADMAAQPPPPSPQELMAQARIQTAEIQREVAKGRDDAAIFIAQLKTDMEKMQLAQTAGLTLAQIEAALQGEQIKVDSQERRQITEIATDLKVAREARARGEDAPGSGGSFNAGKPDGR